MEYNFITGMLLHDDKTEWDSKPWLQNRKEILNVDRDSYLCSAVFTSVLKQFDSAIFGYQPITKHTVRHHTPAIMFAVCLHPVPVNNCYYITSRFTHRIRLANNTFDSVTRWWLSAITFDTLNIHHYANHTLFEVYVRNTYKIYKADNYQAMSKSPLKLLYMTALV